MLEGNEHGWHELIVGIRCSVSPVLDWAPWNTSPMGTRTPDGQLILGIRYACFYNLLDWAGDWRLIQQSTYLTWIKDDFNCEIIIERYALTTDADGWYSDGAWYALDRRVQRADKCGRSTAGIWNGTSLEGSNWISIFWVIERIRTCWQLELQVEKRFF